jgi:hypothetical protein
MSNWTFFSDEEVAGLVGDTAAMLDMAHGFANKVMAEATGNPKAYVKFILTATTNGVHAANSAHYRGLAVDIGLGHLAEGAERDSARGAIVAGLILAGFRRVEPCPLHVHADRGQAPDYLVPWMAVGQDS